MHKLMTKAIEARFAKVGRDEETPLEERAIVAKFFNPNGAGTWYALEYDPETRRFFGWVAELGCDELGYFSLDELQNFRGRFGLPIERDLYFGEHTLGDVFSKVTS